MYYITLFKPLLISLGGMLLGVLLALFPVTISVNLSGTTDARTFNQNLQSQHQRNVEGHEKSNLLKFFRKYHCPEINYGLIDLYIQTADQNGIDYRLLPAISIAESSCGQHYRYFNLYGWNSARSGFSSFEEGLKFVSFSLGFGSHYAGKTIEQKLRIYNPPSVNPLYAPTVLKLMREIGN